jgi:hypothetical protein
MNQTGMNLDEVQARLGEYRCRTGFLVSGGSKTTMDFSHPLAKDADVYWKRVGDDTYWNAHLAALSWPTRPSGELEHSRMDIVIGEQRVTLRLVLKDGSTALLAEAEPKQLAKADAPKYSR